MIVKPSKQQREDEFDAILVAIASAAEPDVRKLQKNIRNKQTQSYRDQKQSAQSSYFWKFSYGMAVVLMMAALWFTFSEKHQLPMARIVYTQGDGVVWIDSSGNANPAKAKDEFLSETVIRTGANSQATILLADLSVIRLDSLSTIKINSKEELVLESGKLFASVTPRNQGQERFFISAGDVDVQVIGTEFEVNRNENDVQVSVEEGVVQVIALDADHQSVNKNSTVQYQNDKLGTPYPASSIADWKDALIQADTEVLNAMLKIYPSRSQDVFN